MNPDQAAEMMTNPDGSLSAADEMNPADGGSGDETPGVSESKGVFDRLFNSEPETPLEQIESPWQPDVGGPARIYRGIQKIGDIEGLPAVADLVIGVAETVYQQQDETETVESEIDDSQETDLEVHEI